VVLHILVGYVARPMGIQVLVYVATLISVLLASALVLRTQRVPAQSAAS
jgi:high-affinity iron transporter